MPPGYAAPAKKRRWPLILAIVGIVVLLGLGGCVLVLRKGFGALSAPVDASNLFLTAVAKDDNAEIARLRCPNATSTINDVRRLRQLGFDGEKSLRSSMITNNMATVTGTIGTTSGTVRITVELTHPGTGVGEKGWCVTRASAS